MTEKWEKVGQGRFPHFFTKSKLKSNISFIFLVGSHPISFLIFLASVTISRAFARKGKLKIFFRAQKNISRAMREKGYFKRFLGCQNSYVVKNEIVLKISLICKSSKFKPTLKRKKMQ